jgi:hypothetical protein
VHGRQVKKLKQYVDKVQKQDNGCAALAMFVCALSQESAPYLRPSAVFLVLNQQYTHNIPSHAATLLSL